MFPQCSSMFPNVLQCSSPLGIGVLIDHTSDEKYLFIIYCLQIFLGKFRCAKKSVKKCRVKLVGAKGILGLG
jgi:hypothetical protein